MPSFSNVLQKRWLRGIILGLLAFWLVAPMGFLPVGDFLENRALDFCYQWRPSQPPARDILVVGIDEPSFQELRRGWPWPRSWHAALIRRLQAAGARVIVFDVVFADPGDPADDAEFAAALKAAGNVILAKTIEMVADPRFRRQILITPLPQFAGAARGVGLAMVTPDADGVVRRFAATLAGQETLALLAARLYDPRAHVSGSQQGLINFVGGSRSLDCVSYYQVIDPQHPLPAARIRDKIVLVGRMLEASVAPQGQADMFYTPHFSLTGQTMAGVEIQGNIIHTLLTDTAGHTLPVQFRVGFSLLAFLLAGYLFARLSPLTGLLLLRLSPLTGLLLVAAVLALGAGAVLLLFWYQRLWVPPVLWAAGLLFVYGGNALCHYFLVSREKRWLRQAFSRYVSHSLVELITAHPERLRLGGEKVTLTVLFSDLAGFTGISEGLTPEALIQLLNEYFTRMTDIILACQGTLDKYIGDAIMAFWGAPLPLAKPASLACQAALAMQQALGPLREHWQRQGLPAVSARIGIHTGPAIVGNVGSRERFNYTVMGDTVNLASRLEGVNKIYGTHILLSESTYQQVQTQFLCRELDSVRVKGRTQPVVIYELLGRLEDQARFPWLATFAAALAAYRQGHWDQAASLFQEVLALCPDDPPALTLHRRVQAYRQQPPPHWQGVYTLDTK